MANELILKAVKINGRTFLEASDMVGEEYLSSLPFGAIVKCSCTRPRNVRFHRLAFGLLSFVFKYQSTWTTFDHFLTVMKDATGYYDLVSDAYGDDIKVYRSLSFTKLDETGFREWWGAAFKVVLERILPGIDREEIEQQVYNMTGERGPNDY